MNSWKLHFSCVISWNDQFLTQILLYCVKTQIFLSLRECLRAKKICVIAWLGTPPGGASENIFDLIWFKDLKINFLIISTSDSRKKLIETPNNTIHIRTTTTKPINNTPPTFLSSNVSEGDIIDVEHPYLLETILLLSIINVTVNVDNSVIL